MDKKPANTVLSEAWFNVTYIDNLQDIKHSIMYDKKKTGGKL